MKRIKSLLRLSSFELSTQDGRSNERYRRLAFSTIAAALAKTIGYATALISVPLTLNYLGVERYGLWMTISSVIAMMAFSDFGLGSGLVRALIKSNGKNDKKSAQEYVSSVFFILCFIAGAILFVFLFVYSIIPWANLLNVSTSLAVSESGPTFAVLLLCFAIAMPLSIVQRVQIGYQEGFNANIWQSLASLAGLCGVLIGIYLEVGLPWLIGGIAGLPLLIGAINWYAQFYRVRPWLLPQWNNFQWRKGKALIGIGMSFVALQIFALIGNASDNIVLAQLLGPEAVVEYSIAQKLATAALIAQFFITPLWPAFGDALERREYDWARRALRRALFLSMGITIPMALLFVLFGPEIIKVWIRPSRQEILPSTALLVALACWMVLASYGGVMSVLLNHGSLLKKQVWAYGIASIVVFFLKYLLVNLIGIPGVSWATVIGYGLFYVIPSAVIAKNALRPPSVGVVAN